MRFAAIFLLLCLYKLIYCAKFVREFIPQKFGNCPIEKLPMRLVITAQQGVNSVSVGGRMEMTEDIAGDLTATIEVNKCDLELKNCVNYCLLKFTEMCGVFANKMGVFAAVMKTIQPPLKCPLRVGNYTFVDSVFDFSMFTMVPIDGAIWMANFKLIGANGKNKRTVMCFSSETKIVRTRVKS